MDNALFGLPIAHTSAWIFNCYILGDGDSDLVLVDPGLPIVAEQALQLIKTQGRDPADIASIMCTHGHPDHVGGVSTIVRESNAEVHLPARCKPYLEGEEPRTFGTVEAGLRFLPILSGQPFSFRSAKEFARLGTQIGFGGLPTMKLDFEPSSFLEDGNAMPSAPGWESIHAPGHTDDSTCLYHAESCTLISGDAVVTENGSPWFNPEYVDLKVSKETEERLRSLDVRHLLPGHGHPIEATDVWKTAKSSTDKPGGRGILARCSRAFGRW